MTRELPSLPIIGHTLVAIGAAGLALFIGRAPAIAAGDISNFNVRNCTTERIFVCSFDKTDSLMKVPYKARGIQPGKRKEFGCASTGRCKVIIGVSKKKAKRTLSNGMHKLMESGAGTMIGTGGLIALNFTAGGIAGILGATTEMTATAASGAAAAILAVAVGGAIGGIEVADGWSDGEVCNQVRSAAQKAGMTPRDFAQNGKKYRVVPQYATDNSGNVYVNPDGTAALTFAMRRGDSCPAPLKIQLVPN